MDVPSGFRHDVFLSYSRSQSWPAFVNGHFRPVLDHWLGAELGIDVRVFQDINAIQVGQRWPREIARGLAESRVLVALLSRNYFQSEWCRHELGAMLARADWLRDRGLDDQVIFPVAMHDCEMSDLPEAVRSLQVLRIHPYADPFMHPESALREALSRALRPLCEQVARRLERITEDTFTWPPPDDSTHLKLLVPDVRVRPTIPVLGGHP